jgi:tetratricopeptide (TPR) repeat protein
LLQAQDSAWVYYKLADKQFMLGKKKEAEVSLKKSLAIQATDSAYTLMSFIVRDDNAKALAYLDSAIMIVPSMGNYLRRGFTRVRHKVAYDTLAVVADLKAAISAAPDSAEPYRRMASVVDARGFYDEAVEYYNKACQLDTNPCVRYFRGMFYHHHKKYKEALEDLMASYNCEAHFKEQLFAGMIADCMLQLKDTVGACKFLSTEARAYGVWGAKDMYIKHCLTSTAEIFYWQGLYDIDKKRKDFAIHSFTKSIEASPSDSAYWQRGRCYKGNVDDKKAIADFDTAIMLNPNNAEVYIDRGIRKGVLGDVKGELADYDKAISLNPKIPSAYWLKAMTYGNDKQKKYKQAVEILNEGVKAVPSSGNMYKYRADAYRNMGKYKEAIDDYTKALSLDAAFKDLIYTGRAACRDKLGDKEGACSDWFEAAVKSDKGAKNIYISKCGL